MARSGLPDPRGVAGAHRALDAARDSDAASGRRERQPNPDSRPSDWELEPVESWTRDAVVLARPGRAHSIYVFWREGAFEHWYVNFEEPLRRTPVGFDTFDQKLDLIVMPDGTYRWKDEDELEQAAALGLLDPEAVRAEAARVLEEWPFPTGLGGLAAGSGLADPTASGRLGPRVRRRGPLAAFFAFGCFWGGWAALVPAIQDAVGASKGELGLALLFVGFGSLPAMLVTGREIDRRGARLIPGLLAGLGLAVLLPAFAGSVPALAASLFVIGVLTGALDVAINAAVSELELRRGTRLMQLAHALFSAECSPERSARGWHGSSAPAGSRSSVGWQWCSSLPRP